MTVASSNRSAGTFRHVLLPTDFSDAASNAVDAAVALASKLDAKLTLLHVYVVPPPMYGGSIPWPVTELAASARHELERAAFALKQRYPKSESLLRSGNPADQIVQAAQECGADLIVMGTHGRTGLPHFLLGSVAERIVRTSPVPVLTVAPERTAQAL